MKLLRFLSILAAFTLVGYAEAANPIVIIETSLGTIRAELFEDKSPITVKNFLTYVDDKFYDGTIFHRVMGRENSRADFIVQGGGYESGMKEKKARPPIESESANGLKNVRGTLAMARKAQAASATCQFFINVTDNESLDRDKAADEIGQCVFGKVIDGLAVVDKIKAVKTTVRGQHANVPVDDIVIKSVRRDEPTKPAQ